MIATFGMEISFLNEINEISYVSYSLSLSSMIIKLTNLSKEKYEELLNKCKTQYLSYLNAEANLLKYMSKLAHFICRKAVSNKQDNDKKEDETVKESLTLDKKNAL